MTKRPATTSSTPFFMSFIVTFVALSAALSLSVAAAGSNLDGEWQLNHQRSDDPQEKIEQALGKGGGLLGGLAKNRKKDAMQRLATTDEKLAIKTTSNQVVISGSEGRHRTLYTDGRRQQYQTKKGKQVQSVASWHGDQLIVETLPESGAKIIESYALADGGRQMYVTLQIESEHFSQPLVIRRVYDARR